MLPYMAQIMQLELRRDSDKADIQDPGLSFIAKFQPFHHLRQTRVATWTPFKYAPLCLEPGSWLADTELKARDYGQQSSTWRWRDSSGENNHFLSSNKRAGEQTSRQMSWLSRHLRMVGVKRTSQRGTAVTFMPRKTCKRHSASCITANVLPKSRAVVATPAT